MKRSIFTQLVASFILFLMVGCGIWTAPQAPNAPIEAAPMNEDNSAAGTAGLVGGLETMLIYGAFIQWHTQLFVEMSVLVMLSVVQRLIWASGALRN